MTLSFAELLLAGQVASMRRVSAIRKGRQLAYGCERDEAWGRDFEGCCGEMAVAKLLDRYWSGTVGRIDAGDVGDLEVRATTRPNGCLVLHDADKDDSPYFLVTGSAPHFDVVGWCYGREGKQQQHWRDPTGKNRHAYFVPQNSLRKVTLPFRKEE